MNKGTFAKELEAVYKTKDQIVIKQLTSSRNSSSYCRSVYPVQIDYKEAFICLFLNRKNDVIGYSTISIGGISATVVDPKIVFQNALLCNASAIIMCHNHPSGNLKPSQADINLTKKIVEGGKVLDISVLDHIILTEENYYSFADEGMM
jgi:DNA repair protein RadC